MIYYLHSEKRPASLLAAFGKNEKANIPAEKKKPAWRQHPSGTAGAESVS